MFVDLPIKNGDVQYDSLPEGNPQMLQMYFR